MPQIKFAEKPTAEILALYKERLEYLLSGIKAKVDIEIYEKPLDIHTYVNDVETEIERIWIKGFIVSAPEVHNIGIKMFHQGIGEDWRREAWDEAYNIQGVIYKSLGRNPGHPGMGDPFWELWNRLEEKS